MSGHHSSNCVTATQTEEMALLSLLTLLLVVNSGWSARIAGFLTIGGSQYMNMRLTMEELASRGHEVQKHHFNMYAFLCPKERQCGVYQGTLIVNFTLLMWVKSLSWVSY